jgi:urease accessory protein
MLRLAARLAIAGLAFAPGWAMAHSPIPGIGYFYSGVLHPFVVPAQWMALLALGMLAGQHGLATQGRAAAAWLAALGLGLAAAARLGAPDTDLLLLGGCLVLALSVVVARPLPAWGVAVAAIVIGLLLGLGSSPDGLSGAARWGSLAGTGLGATVGLLWAAALTEAAARPWLKVAVRVVASWLGACALLVLALTWVGPARGSKSVGETSAPAQAAWPQAAGRSEVSTV